MSNPQTKQIADKKKIIIIDETLREGMQHRGLMFSQDQRKTVLDFQEHLGVDICQAGYPSAHDQEAQTIHALVRHAEKKHYTTRIAAMGRPILKDAAIMLNTGIIDFHFHLHIPPDLDKTGLNRTLKGILPGIELIKKKCPQAVISLAMLDIGRTATSTLERCTDFCSQNRIDILSLPDTSGMMAPSQIYNTLRHLKKFSGQTRISVHCHNDMGMASANSVMGIDAGGQVLEASVLGIGERNGIADLFTTAETLRNIGYDMNLNLSDIKTFKAYYQYVDQIIYDQLQDHRLDANTPFFGDAVKTHVAGTHAGGNYGLATEEHYYLNSLCGRHLVQKFMNFHQIDCPDKLLARLTQEVKSRSIQLNRSLTPRDLKKIIVLLSDSG